MRLSCAHARTHKRVATKTHKAAADEFLSRSVRRVLFFRVGEKKNRITTICIFAQRGAMQKMPIPPLRVQNSSTSTQIHISLRECLMLKAAQPLSARSVPSENNARRLINGNALARESSRLLFLSARVCAHMQPETTPAAYLNNKNAL